MSAIKIILFGTKRKITKSNSSFNESPLDINNHLMKVPRFFDWRQTQYAL